MSTLRQSPGRTDSRPSWVRFLEGCCGVKAYRWHDWADFITSGPGGLAEMPSDDEMLAAVQFAEGRGERMEPVTSRRLAGWVKWYRKEQAAGRHGYNRNTGEGRQDEVWQMMTRAQHHDQRWELLVEGGPALAPDAEGHYRYRENWTDRDRDALSMRARNRWPDWDAAIIAYKNRFERAQVKAFSTIAAGMEPSDAEDVPF